MASVLLPGHYLAIDGIPCRPPFGGPLVRGESFDVLEGNNHEDRVLIRRDDGMRVWKPAQDLLGKVVCLHRMVVADDGYHMVLPRGGRVFDGECVREVAR